MFPYLKVALRDELAVPDGLRVEHGQGEDEVNHERHSQDGDEVTHVVPYGRDERNKYKYATRYVRENRQTDTSM